MNGIKFFGKVDRNKSGHVASDLPSWMMKAQMKDLVEKAESTERMLDRGIYEPDQIPYMKAEVSKMRQRIDEITSSKPTVEGGDKDRLAKSRKELGEKIMDSNFKYSDMMTGEADAHEEAERMSRPCIDVPKELADACDIRLENGKANRNDAIRAWRIAGGYLGEDTNPTHLHSDRKKGK